MNTNTRLKSKVKKSVKQGFFGSTGEIATGKKINQLKNGEAVHITRNETISELTNKPYVYVASNGFQVKER